MSLLRLLTGFPAAEVALPTVTFSQTDKSTLIFVDSGDLRVRKTAGTASTWDGVRSTLAHSSGKRYFEVRFERYSGSGFNGMVGIATSSAPVDTATGFPGGTNDGYGVYWLSGDKYRNSVGSSCLAAGDADDRYQVAVDFGAGKVWFGRNGTFSGDPSAGTGEAFSGVTGAHYAMVSLLNPSMYQATAAFRSSDFAYSPPSGFGAWGG